MINLLKNRRSIRKFTDEAVSKEDLQKILKAGLLSPSSMGKNPVEFIVIQDKEIIAKLEECKKFGTVPLKTSPLVICILADSELSDVWVEDASIVSILMQLEVEKLGLGSTWIQIRNRECSEGDSQEAVRKVLSIPKKYGVLSLIAIGHKNEEKKPYTDEDLNFEKVHYENFNDKNN